MGATEKIAKWIIDTGYEDIPPDAIRVANESCFDLLGVILAGSTEPVGEIIRQYVADQGGNRRGDRAGDRPAQHLLPSGPCQRDNGPRPGLRRLRRVSGIPRWQSSPLCWPWERRPAQPDGTCWKPMSSAVRLAWLYNTQPSTTRWRRDSTPLPSSATWPAPPPAPSCWVWTSSRPPWRWAWPVSMAGGLIHNFGTMTKPLHAGLVLP